MKKLILSFFVAAFITVVVLMAYVIKTFTVSDLIYCSAYPGTYYIPPGFCEYYLINHGASKADIQALMDGSSYLQATEKGAGVVQASNYDAGAIMQILVGIADRKKRDTLIDFFISNGLDINSTNMIDGFTVLHAAILSNDADLVMYLLSKGANPLRAVDNQNAGNPDNNNFNGMTAYDFSDYLIANDSKKSEDRDAVRNILLEFRGK